MKQKMLVGTIHGVFVGALDGLPARLLRTGKFGYMVELLASTDTFHQGDHVHLSVTEFDIDQRTRHEDAPRQRQRQAEQHHTASA
jgi:hypothetical protein